VQKEGTPLPFVIVAVVFLTALMMGWRLVFLARVQRGRGRDHPDQEGSAPAGIAGDRLLQVPWDGRNDAGSGPSRVPKRTPSSRTRIDGS
jgi:hypothetical protein